MGGGGGGVSRWPGGGGGGDLTYWMRWPCISMTLLLYRYSVQGGVYGGVVTGI